MSRLNYHHLLYFWSVAKHGSVAAAAKRLHLAQPTISAQVRSFERSLGHVLLAREGRGLALTAMGRTVFRFADEIFTLGSELLDAVRGHEPSSRVVLRVGVVDVLPKLLVYRMLRPVLALPENLRLVCYEGKLSDLAARLAVHDLDVVLADVPLTPQAGVRAFSHRLGESSLAVFAAPPLARKYAPAFPGSLEGAPLLVPTSNTAARRAVDHWLESRNLRPRIVGEFEDSALIKAFGQSGVGLFFAPSILEREVRQQFAVRSLGRIDAPKEQYYALSMERRIRHPGVAALTGSARISLTDAPQAR